MKGFIVLVIVAATAQVALSGCSKPKYYGDSGNYNNGQLLSEEYIDVDRHQGSNWNSGGNWNNGGNWHGGNCGCSRPQPACQCEQKFILRTPEVNVYPNIKHCASNIDFAPKVYTKQRCSKLQIKPIVVKVEKEIQPKRKMVCRYINLPNHQCDSSCGGYESGSGSSWDYSSGSGKSHGSSCGCGCNK